MPEPAHVPMGRSLSFPFSGHAGNTGCLVMSVLTMPFFPLLELSSQGPAGTAEKVNVQRPWAWIGQT